MTPQEFYLSVVRRDPRFISSDLQSDPALLEPVTRAAVLGIVAAAKRMGHDLGIFETIRSPQRQRALFARGTTRLRTVGCHHFAVAADLVKRTRKGWSWAGDYSFLGPLARDHGMLWGIQLRSPDGRKLIDGAHVQRVAIVDQPRLFDGSFYPDEKYDPYGRPPSTWNGVPYALPDRP